MSYLPFPVLQFQVGTNSLHLMICGQAWNCDDVLDISDFIQKEEVSVP